MTLYRFDGDARPGYHTAYVVTDDSSYVRRKVRLGRTIDLTADQLLDLQEMGFVFNLATGSVTSAIVSGSENVVNKGQPNGYASLDGTGKVPSAQLPAASGGAITVKDETTALTQRSTISFQGAGVTAADDSANAQTVVTIPGATGGSGASVSAANTWTARQVFSGSGAVESSATVQGAQASHLLVVNRTGGAPTNGNVLLVTGNDFSNVGPMDTTFGISGYETGKGTIKATHNRPVAGGTIDDSSASVLSLRCNGVGTAAQGIFFDAEDTGGTTGNLIEMRQVGVAKFRVNSAGSISVVANIIMSSYLQLGTLAGNPTPVSARVQLYGKTNGSYTDLVAQFPDGSTQTIAPQNTAPNVQTASYTLVLTDIVVEMNSASATTVTVPPNSSVAFPIGTVIEICRYGAGAVTIAAGAGVTVRPPSGSPMTIAAQYGTVSLRKRATDEWILAGNLG